MAFVFLRMPCCPSTARGTCDICSLSPPVLQVTTLHSHRLAGIAHAVDVASAGYTKSELISTFRPLTLRTSPSIGPHGVQLQRLVQLHDDDDDDVLFCHFEAAHLVWFRNTEQHSCRRQQSCM